MVAIMLGHLRMNVDEAIDALITVATAVFPEGSQDATDPEANSRNLKDAIEDMLQARNIPVNTKMYERSWPQPRCKVYVYSFDMACSWNSASTSVLYAATSSNIRHPQAFRNYSFRGASMNPTIVEAVCATMAIPSYFLPTKIGRSHQSFVGSALGANNPTRELLKEAGSVFGNEKRVAQILSVGCGVPPVLSLQVMTNETGVGRLVREMPDECETVAKELAARLYSVDAYLRLSVERGMGAIELDQWGMLGDIEVHTARYIETESSTKAVEASLQRIQQRIGTVTLGHLST